MIREAIAKLEEIVRKGEEARVVEVDGVKYVDRQVVDLRKKDPEPETLEVYTLQAVVDYIAANRDGLPLEKYVLHVESEDEVVLRGPLTGHFHQRHAVLRAEADDLTVNRLNRYHPVEEMIVSLQALFVPSPERAEILRVLGNVKDEVVRTQVDDGVTQQVSARAGALVEALTVPNPVTLAPFRTFREVEQPASPMVFRVKKTEDGIMAGLFEADGAAWRLEAVKRIRAWLEDAGVSPVVILG